MHVLAPMSNATVPGSIQSPKLAASTAEADNSCVASPGLMPLPVLPERLLRVYANRRPPTL